jgi:Zn-finger nucleic acid-binding protein
MDDGITNEVLDCPRGCGTLEYQSTAGAFQSGNKGLVGKGLIIASIAIFVAYNVWLFASGNGTNENLNTGQLFMVGIICFGIFVLGANIGVGDSWNHHCKTCKGVMLDSKTVSEKFWGEGGTTIRSLMEEIGDSVGALNCPGCGEKMGLIPISYTPVNHSTLRRHHNDPSVAAIALLFDLAIAVKPTSEENLEIDACNDCMMLWFDGGESSKINDSLSIRGT